MVFKININRIAGFLTVAMAYVMTAGAASKEDYALETRKFLRETNEVPRSTGATRNVLDKDNTGSFGRGQITIVRSMISVGRELKDQDLLDQSKQIVLACNKVVVDGVDTPKKETIGQVAFALYELVFAYRQLKGMEMLTPEETARTEKMLKGCAGYWLKERPTQGEGNLDMRYALGVASVANTFPQDPGAQNWRKWSELTFYNILRFPECNGAYESTKWNQKCSLKKEGNSWKFIPDAEQPSPIFSPGIAENCNGYVGATVLTWICLGEALDKRKEMAMPEVEAWLDTLYAQIMPNGILPVYGDSSWGPQQEWIGIFEWMGRVFKKPEYRQAAQRMLDYARQQKVMLGDTSEAIEFSDETITPQAAPRGSSLTMRQSGYGRRIPDKIILRGNGDAKSQPYVFVQALHGGGHSHPHGGAISAYALGESVVLHDFGYDATAPVFHDMFLVRSPTVDFLGFTDFFKDPKGSLLSKIVEGKGRLTTFFPAADRQNTDAECLDFIKVAYGRVAYDLATTNWDGRNFAGRGFRHTRELALEKDSGILVVFDSLECLNKGDLSAGPVWHAQKVLAENADGFLIQDENPANNVRNNVFYTCPPRPVWMALAGSGKNLNKIERTTWHFKGRSGREEEPQDEHIVLRYTGPGGAGQTLSFLTVFAPQPKGSVEIPKDVRAEIVGNQAVGLVGDWEFRFGQQKLSDQKTGERSARFSATLKVQGQQPYKAAVLTEGEEKKFEMQ
ncbi:MAG: hypothetical protein WC637_05470 [Victivallales bacterium]